MTDIEMLLESDVTFTDFSEEEDVVKVKGFLCHEGIMNRQTFTKEKIDKAAPSFVGVPITTAHSSGIDVVIGGVDYTEGKPDESKDGLYGMYFEGRIGSEYSNIVNNIKRGFLNKLSMRIGPESSPSHFCNICGEPIGKCKHDFETPNFNPIVNDFYGKHVAIVTEPADRNTSITMSFSDGTTEELNLDDYIRRTKMSDFEEKYSKLLEDHNQLKMEHKEEIEKLQADFDAEKETLQQSIEDKASEYSSLKSDFDALTQEHEELKVTAKNLADEFAKIEEARLSEKRAEVIELNTEMSGILTEEDINSFSEARLDFFINQYTNQKKHMAKETIKEPIDPTNQYSEKEKTESVDPIQGMLDFVNKL